MLDEKSLSIASVMVLCTTPGEAIAQGLAAKVLTEKLVACATSIPGATSFYYWESKLEQEREVQMILRTTVSHQRALLEHLRSHHPYQTPELLVLPVTYGDTDCLSWLNASLRRSCYFATLPFLSDYSVRRGVHDLSPRTKPSFLIFDKTNMILIWPSGLKTVTTLIVNRLALRRNTRKLPTCNYRKASDMKMSFAAKARFTVVG